MADAARARGRHRLAHARPATSSTPSTSRASAPSSSTPSATSSVRGDLLPLPDGVRLSPFPHDPDLPSLPLLMDPATVGPLVRWNRAHARRPAALPPRQARHGPLTSGDTSVVAKAYHDRTKAAAVAEESVALADAAHGAATLRFAPIVAHLDDLGWVVQHPVHGCTAGRPRRQHPAQPERGRGGRPAGRASPRRAARLPAGAAPGAVGRQGAASASACAPAASPRSIRDSASRPIVWPRGSSPRRSTCRPPPSGRFTATASRASSCSTRTTVNLLDLDHCGIVRPGGRRRHVHGDRCASTPSGTLSPDGPRRWSNDSRPWPRSS